MVRLRLILLHVERLHPIPRSRRLQEEALPRLNCRIHGPTREALGSRDISSAIPSLNQRSVDLRQIEVSASQRIGIRNRAAIQGEQARSQNIRERTAIWNENITHKGVRSGSREFD